MQYGNLTRVEEYGNNDNLIRTTVRDYVPNNAFGTWIVGAVAQEVLYAGTVDLANWQSIGYYLYDNQAPFYAPTVGSLTRVMRVKDYNTSSGWATTVDTAYGYKCMGLSSPSFRTG